MVNVRDYNAPNLALPTNLRAILRTGDILFGTWCHIACEEAARIVAMLPHEFCFVDGEHSPFGPLELSNIIRAINVYSGGSMVPVVRCTTPEMVNHALNAGAGGIIMPHIQSQEQAEALVRLVRFPPRGDRSVPPNVLLGKNKIMPPGVRTYDIWNDHVAIFAQVEDIHGLRNVEEIASVPGLDAIMVGGWDLQSSLGIEPSETSLHHPLFLESIQKIQRAADRNGLAVMGGAHPDTLQNRIQLGWRLFICGTDAAAVLAWGEQALNKYKEISASIPLEPIKNGNGHKKALENGKTHRPLENGNGFLPLQNGDTHPQA